jgi:membrane protein
VSIAVRNRVGNVWSFVGSVVRTAREEDLSFMAGSIAFSAFLSLLPLLLLAVVAASVIGGEAMVERVLALTQRYLTPSARTTLAGSMRRATNHAGFSVFGLATLLWSVLRVFRCLDTAFTNLYDTPGKDSILDQLTDGLVVLAAIGTAVLAMLAASVALAVLPSLPFVEVLNVLGLVVGLTFAFLPIYYVFPDMRVAIGDVLPGAVFAAVGWTALQGVFQVYVAIGFRSELYGVIGGAILLVTWLYFAAVVLLLGAAINVVLAGRGRRRGPRAG